MNSSPGIRFPGLLPAVCLGLLLAVPLRAAGYRQVQKDAELCLEAGQGKGGRIEIPTSGTTLTITLHFEPAGKINWKETVNQSREWKVRLLPFATSREGRFHLEPLGKPGAKLVLRLPPLWFRKPGGRDQRLVWKPVRVRITSEIKEPSLAELRPISPPEQLPPAWSWRRPLSWVLPALVALALGLVVWQLIRRQARRVVALTPEAWALRELKRLGDLDLSRWEEVQRFPTLVSDVVRGYLEMRFLIRAPRQTTAEFLAALQQAPQLPPELQQALKEFLERCDLAKFAQAIPSADECQTLSARARAVVEQASEEGIRGQESGVSSQQPAGRLC
jgi:hypothetical protein